MDKKSSGSDDDEIQEISPPTQRTENIGEDKTKTPAASSTYPGSSNKPTLSHSGLLEGLKFMADFDPMTSSRNQKRKKRYGPDGGLIQYAHDFENCDCLVPTCAGCHNPCKSCEDPRCGKECRINRKWVYHAVEVEGHNIQRTNPHADAFTSN